MKKIYALSAFLLSYVFVQGQLSQQRTDTFRINGNFQWTVPCDVTRITVEAWGAGAGGNKNGGGGGGAYARKNLIVSGGEQFQLTVGEGGGAKTAGGNTVFGNDLVKAEGGGQSGTLSDGGRINDNSGYDLEYKGGNGGINNGNGNGNGAGGGSSASSSGIAQNGSSDGSGGNAPLGGGDGGNGNKNGSEVTDGEFPGGGGGSNGSNGSGNGSGADGQIIISYTSVYGSFLSKYCIPDLKNGGQVQPITYVELNGQSNSSTDVADEYRNFCNPVFEVEKGQGYQITVKGKVRTNKVAYVTAFIDWNQDGDFDDAGEKINIGENSKVKSESIQTYIHTIQVPQDAVTGTTKLRIIFREDGYPANACDDFKFGQAEDYNININDLQPVVSIPDQAATICSGGTFLVSPVNDPPSTVIPDGTRYSWSAPSISGIEGAASGANQSSVSGTLINTADTSIDVIYNVTASAGSGPGTSFKIIVRVNSTGTWLGKTSEWNDGKNWCGGIPTSKTNVNIPATGSQTPYYLPVINGSASVKDLIISSGTTVTLGSCARLNIGGAITGEGKINATSGTIQLKGSSMQEINGNVFINKTIENLRLSNSNGIKLVADSDTLNITGKVSFGASNVNFVTNGHLTLKSTAERTASIGDLTDGGTLSGNKITGDVVVERYINIGTGNGQHAKGWLFLATPTLGQSVSDSWMEGKSDSNDGYGINIPNNVGKGWDAGTVYAPSIKRYDYQTDTWVSKNNDGQSLNASDSLYNPNGWMVFVRGDRSVTGVGQDAKNTNLRSKGNLLTGDQKFTVPAKKDGFYSIGNPYASAVDMSKVDGLGNYGTFYVWVPSFAGLYGLGAYQTFTYDDDLGGYVSVPGNDTVNNYVLSGQAFFVQTGDEKYDVIFHENSKEETSVNTAFFRGEKGTSSKSGYLRTNLFTSNDNAIDGTAQFFSDNYSNDINIQDGRKLTNSGINLSLRVAGRSLAVERRQIYNSTDTVFFNLAGSTNGSYYFVFDVKDIAASGSEAWLEDAFTKQRTPVNLNGKTKVSFDVTADAASKAANRFRIVFKPAFALPVTFVRVDAINDGGQVNVKWTVADEINLSKYVVMKSTDGNNFTDLTDVPAAGLTDYSAIDMNAAGGYNYYRIRSVDRDGTPSYSEIVKVFVGNDKPSLRVFPNPIVNGAVNLRLENMPSGKYQARLISQGGQVMLTHSFEQSGGLHNEKIPWNYNMAHGNYSLQVTAPDGTLRTIKIIY